MAVEFRQATLGNGLTVIGECDAEAHTGAMGFFVKTGARDESAGVMGVSHFLEHMMFKGTERRTADDVNRDFDRIGASYNAYTSGELTCFYASTLPEYLPTASDILCDIMRPSLRDADFDSEKNVILEEIAMYADQPFWRLYETAMERYYGDHPLSHRVLGTNETIRALQREQMSEYFAKRYSADNTTVALAGRVDFDAAVGLIERACGGWERTGAARDGFAPRVRGEEFTLTDPKVQRSYLLMVAPGPSAQDDRRYAAMLLAQILGGSDNSRLHWALIETGLAEEAQAAFDPRDGCGDFYVFASGDPENARRIEETILRAVDGLIESLEEDDLVRLRNKVATSVTLAGERPGGRMQRLGRLWTYLDRYETLEDELAKIHAVTLDDLLAVWSAYPFAPRTVGRLVPG
ncbi:MAG: M16 family metallopeptidase [Phycisphaerales bacterium]